VSVLDWVTVETEIDGISHEKRHYETKTMKLWGDYLIDKSGLLFRKDDDTPEWTFENFTGSFEMVGDAAGYYKVTFNEGRMTSLVHWMYSA
jgi:hypothetical protein